MIAHGWLVREVGHDHHHARADHRVIIGKRREHDVDISMMLHLIEHLVSPSRGTGACERTSSGSGERSGNTARIAGTSSRCASRKTTSATMITPQSHRMPDIVFDPPKQAATQSFTRDSASGGGAAHRPIWPRRLARARQIASSGNSSRVRARGHGRRGPRLRPPASRGVGIATLDVFRADHHFGRLFTDLLGDLVHTLAEEIGRV